MPTLHLYKISPMNEPHAITRVWTQNNDFPVYLKKRSVRFHGYHKSAYFTHACGRCFPGATEATNNTEPVFVSESTCRPQTREQLAAPSNIHE